MARTLESRWETKLAALAEAEAALATARATKPPLPATDGVRWHTGATDELTIARPGPGRAPAAALDLIRRHGATHTSTEIAEMLTPAGLVTGEGRPFTASGVARVRDAYKIFGPRTVAVRDGEVSVKQAAAELGVHADAVYNWLRGGQVPARRGPSGRWCILWDPATQEIYRQKVANSFRLIPGRRVAG